MHNFNSNFLKEVQKRSFIQDCTDFEGLDNYISECEQNKKPAIAYIGFDCTASSLHAGSLMQIMALRFFQKSGHKPIVLLGGGTTLIGDPSGKDEARKMLTTEDIEKNKQGIKKVFEKYLEFETTYNPSSNKAFLVDNAEWLKTLNYIDFLRDVGKHFSINRMLKFDSVKTRLEREQDLSFLEFNYMILQAYDFVELANKYNCRLQIGGSDQWGNIVNGTDLFRRKTFAEKGTRIFSEVSKIEENILDSKKKSFKEADKLYQKEYSIFGLTTPLLTTSSGAKMGKTSDGAVWLDEDLLKPYDFWQYWRNTSDADVIKFMKLFVDEFSAEEIEAEGAKAQGAEINKLKIKLATAVTSLCHGKEKAEAAEETARKVFEQGALGGDLPVFNIEKNKLDEGIVIHELLKISGLCESNGKAKDLIDGGGARVNDEKITDKNLLINSSYLKEGVIKLSSGKKKHIIVKVV